MNNRKVMVISIKPKYMKEILYGDKVIELRKSLPREVSTNDLVILYSTMPERAVVGVCKVEEFLVETPKTFWKKHHKSVGISEQEFFSYFKFSSQAYGIKLKTIVPLKNDISLPQIRFKIPDFCPPQTFKYFPAKMIFDLFEKEISENIYSYPKEKIII